MDVGTQGKSLRELEYEFQRGSNSFGREAARQAILKRIVKEGEHLPEEFTDVELLIALAREAGQKNSARIKDSHDFARRALALLEQGHKLNGDAAYELMKWIHQDTLSNSVAATLPDLLNWAKKNKPDLMFDAACRMIRELSRAR